MGAWSDTFAWIGLKTEGHGSFDYWHSFSFPLFVQIPNSRSGCVVYKTDPPSEASKVLKVMNVVMEVDGNLIADDGTVQFMDDESVEFSQRVQSKHIGDMLVLKIWRNRKVSNFCRKLPWWLFILVIDSCGCLQSDTFGSFDIHWHPCDGNFFGDFPSVPTTYSHGFVCLLSSICNGPWSICDKGSRMVYTLQNVFRPFLMCFVLQQDLHSLNNDHRFGSAAAIGRRQL